MEQRWSFLSEKCCELEQRYGVHCPKGAVHAATAALFISLLAAWKPALGFVPPKLKMRFLKHFVLLEL